jgi:hypothetical protein
MVLWLPHSSVMVQGGAPSLRGLTLQGSCSVLEHSHSVARGKHAVPWHLHSAMCPTPHLVLAAEQGLQPKACPRKVLVLAIFCVGLIGVCFV